MRAAFLLGGLLLAAGYSYVAFADLPYLSSAGRLGPGFFPRIIGAALVLLCAWSLAAELRRPSREALSPYWRTTVAVAALSGALVVSLEVLGGALAMVAFMAAALFTLNRGRTLQNVLVALLLPLALYLIFRVWLNASLPRGLLGLPL
jgi:putative tricarboxylic transport membrane protein